MQSIVLLVLLLLAPAAANAQVSATDAAAVSRVFGGSVEVAREFRPASLHADFDGDGVRDLLVVVRRRAGRLPAGVRQVQPWGAGAADGSPLAFAILHGSGAGWARPHLVMGRDFFDTPLWLQPEPGLLRVARRGRRQVVVVPTEAGIDTFLHWSGRTYKIEYPAGEVP